ncbi:MAG: NAD(P)-binding protein [Chloroflexota bacterium]|nr:NAD(P)-binding protein [Chloroflexota bacterium]
MSKQHSKESGNGSKQGNVGAVMVVGAGICGMQASLDLANSGYKVYLVDKTSSIGGRMSQLDKTFPTNDCSMCIISPKLIEVGKHLNIDIITDAEVQSVEGSEGDFQVKIHQKSRFIDLDKCNACGDCVDVCPVSVPSEFEELLGQRKATFRRYPQAIPGAMLIDKKGTSPCKITCPAHISVQGYVALTAQGKYKEALDLIREENPFPAVCGRVCTHPCESECTRKNLDEPISICHLKRFIADEILGTDKDSKPEALASKNKKVAIVGAGPAGLTAAYYLALWGYQPTVFEKLPVVGGMMAVGIPSYRLPSNILKAEIDFIQSIGVEIKTNTPIGESITLDQLASQGYKATFIASGAHRNNTMGVDGEDLQGVLPGVDVLRKIRLGESVPIGQKVAVVGGGNVAIDAARTALRQGAKEVFILYRRSRQEMPANEEEIEEAEEEGIKIHYLVAPVAIEGKNGKVNSVKCIKMELSDPDESGRRKPVPIKGSEYKIDADTVIPAIGQSPDLSFLGQGDGIEASKRETIVVDSLTLETNKQGVFAGGDVVLGPATVIEAIAAGKEAAISIDRYVKGEDLKSGREKRFEAVDVDLEGLRRKPRQRAPRISPEQRKTNYEEVQQKLTEQQAKEEAERCLSCAGCSECYQCVIACGAKAIDHSMQPRDMELNVGSVILAPGIDKFDAEIRGEYGFGRMPNVVTSVQFERILSASGPYQGKVLRPSDGQHPVKVAWIQCVGSRDSTCGQDYCSSVCCMYATKEAIIAKEHDSRIEPTIFYNDMRAFGKGFERYFESAKDHFGIKYVKGLPSGVKELQQTKNLRLEYSGEDGEKIEEDFDMVVLSVGMIPTPGTKELAERLGVELNRFGFCQNPEEFKPNVTSRKGIYVAGAFDAPMDIPESVMSSSSAAFLASRNLTDVRGTMITEKEYPPEIPLDGQEPRVGVFICRCGTNIARVVDIASVLDYAKELPNVILAQENLYTCSTDTQQKMIEAIKEHGLNRVVVASCTPRTHEPLFQDTCREAGLNKYLFEMANIRDQCSWVHSLHMPEATDKAKDLIRMAVARATTLEPLHQMPVDIKRTALVIGGGLAGMTSALGFADQGFECVLVEKAKELGGNLKNVPYTLDGSDPQSLLASLLDRVKQEPKIAVYTEAEVVNFSGFVGNYVTTIQTSDGNRENIEHGIVVVATGGMEYKPQEYLYGESDAVVTQRDFENQLVEGKVDPSNLNSVVMIQCVGSREADHMYCSRVCCNQAVKNALKIKESNPNAQVYILYRDMRTYGLNELKYREARDKGVIFIRYEVEKKPEVTQNGGKLSVNVFDSILGADILLEPDMLILSAATRPQSDAHEFASKLKLPLTQDGFFMEAHMKLRPLDFTNEGMYLCGLAHGPKLISETMSQAQGAVSRALTILSQPHLMAGGVVSVVEQDRCVGCLTCVRSCPFSVPKVNATGVAEIEPAACQGCGICASVCPRKAIQLQHYKDAQVMAKTSVLVA